MNCFLKRFRFRLENRCCTGHARQSVYASSGDRRPRFRLTRTRTEQSSIADAMSL